MPPARAPKENCMDSIYQYAEKAVEGSIRHQRAGAIVQTGLNARRLSLNDRHVTLMLQGQ